MEEQQTVVEPTQKPKQTLKLELNLWWLVGLLAIVIVVMVALWRPWQQSADGRTVTVTGTTTVKATPDEYTFSPSWQFKDADKAAALAAATAKSSDVVASLKKLGVADNKITTNVGGWDSYYYYDTDSKQHVYTLTIGVVTATRDTAQKLQDYLITTTPTGQVSPVAAFSQTKQKSLESNARSAATKDARTKADEMASNLGFKVGKVKSIDDQNGGGIAYPMYNKTMTAVGVATDSASSSLAVQPGENELSYSVQVTYYIR